MPNASSLVNGTKDQGFPPIFATLTCSGSNALQIGLDSDRRYYFLHNQINENGQADTHVILIGTLSGVAPLPNLISQSNVLQISALSSTGLPFVGPGLTSITFLAVNTVQAPVQTQNAFPTFQIIPSEKFYGGY